MKILNKQKTHFLKITKFGLYQIRYDSVKNVNDLINHILDNGHINNLHTSTQVFQPLKKEL